MTEDALGDILNREGVTKFIQSNKESLRRAFLSLIDAYQQLFPDAPLRLKNIGPLIWDIIKWENTIRNVFYLHGFDIKELESYGGPISERIVEEVLRVLEVDLGDIRLKPLK